MSSNRSRPVTTGASKVALVVKNPPASTGDARDVGFDPWVRKISWRRAWHPTPVFLENIFSSILENPMDRAAWEAMAFRVTNSQTRLK